MKGNRNNNSRAVVSALQCDYIDLRLAASNIVDAVVSEDKAHPVRALMIEFDCARNTALRIQAMAKKARRRKS